MTKPVLFENSPSCDRSNRKDKECLKEWAKYDIYEVINKGDANARLRRISEGE